MLEARSVAVVGASVRPGSLGAQMMAELRRGGFDGAVYPVNPGYDEIDGFACYPSILEVPDPVGTRSSLGLQLIRPAFQALGILSEELPMRLDDLRDAFGNLWELVWRIGPASGFRIDRGSGEQSRG